MEEDSLDQPTLPPTRAWISGRDPLLVVSIVATRKNPIFRNCLFFSFCASSCIVTLHVLSNKFIFLKKIYLLFLLVWFIKPSPPFLFAEIWWYEEDKKLEERSPAFILSVHLLEDISFS
jgi:hypothetical protein